MPKSRNFLNVSCASRTDNEDKTNEASGSEEQGQRFFFGGVMEPRRTCNRQGKLYTFNTANSGSNYTSYTRNQFGEYVGYYPFARIGSDGGAATGNDQAVQAFRYWTGVLGNTASLVLVRATIFQSSFPAGRVIYGFMNSADLCNLQSNTTPTPGVSGGAGAKIAARARRYAGTYYRQGEEFQCMNWVRDVLNESCGTNLSGYVVPRAWDGLETGYSMASSLAGDGAGTKITNSANLTPGDIVFFQNTYAGYAPGTITHVGIYVGNGQYMHRPTFDRTVETAQINGSKFIYGTRLKTSLTSSCN